MLVTNLSDLLEVALRWRDDSSSTNHGLSDECGNVLSTLLFNQFFKSTGTGEPTRWVLKF